MHDIELAEAAVQQAWSGWQAEGQGEDRSGRRAAVILSGTDGRRAFVKCSPGEEGLRKMEAEREGLELLAGVPGVRTPEVLGTASGSNGAALALAAVDTIEPTDSSYELLASMVARVHDVTAEAFGLDVDNFIGDFPQENLPRGGDWRLPRRPPSPTDGDERDRSAAAWQLWPLFTHRVQDGARWHSPLMAAVDVVAGIERGAPSITEP